jgi:23S rRNA pseudouridine1911/1915/1917 synthase
VYIAEVARILSRSQLKARDAQISINGRPAKFSHPLKEGDLVELTWKEEPSPHLVAEDIPLSILYEDERCIVVDKAQGMVVHPGAGNRRGTLANALLAHFSGGLTSAGQEAPDLNSVEPDFLQRDPVQQGAVQRGPVQRDPAQRGGIVHRLDKDTSGVIIAAKDLETQVFLASQFKDRRVRKVYLALTRGVPSPQSGRISDRLGRDRRDRKRFSRVEQGGKTAVTDYRVLRVWREKRERGGSSYALVVLRPKTGRTHQLRVHMAGLGSPILGDPIYGKRDPLFPEATLMLHAWRLRILVPGAEAPMVFQAPVPGRFRVLTKRLTMLFGEPVKN